LRARFMVGNRPFRGRFETGATGVDPGLYTP
jgi:hypothetical protein